MTEASNLHSCGCIGRPGMLVSHVVSMQDLHYQLAQSQAAAAASEADNKQVKKCANQDMHRTRAQAHQMKSDLSAARGQMAAQSKELTECRRQATSLSTKVECTVEELKDLKAETILLRAELQA